MKKLKFKPMPDLFGARRWGCKAGNHSFIYSEIVGWGWGASRQDEQTRTTVHAPGAPFKTEQEAIEAIHQLYYQVRN